MGRVLGLNNDLLDIKANYFDKVNRHIKIKRFYLNSER